MGSLVRTRGGIIKRGIVTALAGVAACALAIGGITYALAPVGGTIPNNYIGAGHLVLHVNHDQGSDLDLINLIPGQRRSGDQLITADMGGVGTADLILTLSSGGTGAFAERTSLRVFYSDPEPTGDIGWVGGVCTPVRGYAHQVTYTNLTALTRARTAPLGTLTGDDDGLCVRFEVELDASAGNNVQGTSADLALGYVLQQTSTGTP